MKTKSLRRDASRGVGGTVRVARGGNLSGVGVRDGLGRGGVQVTEPVTDARRQREAKRGFGQLLDWVVDSGGWLLIVVGLFILLPVGVMYLVSQGVKEESRDRHVRVEADILAPVNIFSDRLDGR